jgi:hypothetical protein
MKEASSFTTLSIQQAAQFGLTHMKYTYRLSGDFAITLGLDSWPHTDFRMSHRRGFQNVTSTWVPKCHIDVGSIRSRCKPSELRTLKFTIASKLQQAA